MQPSDEIKSRLDIVEVIRDYIPLKPAGTSFRAICPFHHEKSPSFMVSPEKQIWHCFGCGKGGDIFSFVMEMEGISFVESLRQLANKAGIKLQQVDAKLSSQRNRILDMLDLSAHYFNRALLDSKQAQGTRDYLTRRGLRPDTIEAWRIGYSLDDWQMLTNFLKGRGYNDNEIFLAGLSIKSQDRPGFYDRFRGRIMFPICDVNGNVAAFSARVSPEREAIEKMGKYINSPQTMVYDKGRILFGLNFAKMAIKQADQAIIVEGQMDCITAHQQGFKNVIASSGTALTADQINLIKRYTINISLAFDADKAGEMAAERGMREAMAAEMNAKVIQIPSGKDPDECIRNNPEEWRRSVESAKPVMRYYFDKVFSELDMDSVENRRLGAKKFLAVIARTNNKIEQDYWLKTLSEKIDVNENVLREIFSQARSQELKRDHRLDRKVDAVQAVREHLSREGLLTELMISILLKFHNLIDYTSERVHLDYLSGEQCRVLYKNMVIYYNNIKESTDYLSYGAAEKAFDFAQFRRWATENGVHGELIDKLLLLGERDFFDYEIDQAKDELIKIILELKKYFLVARMKEVEKLIVQTEREGQNDEAIALLEELKAIMEELKELG